MFLSVQPRLFAPFFLDSYTYPMNQEACRLELNGLQCKGSLSGDADIVQNITVEFDAALDVMNYKDLSWRNCLFASSFAAEFSLNSVNIIFIASYIYRIYAAFHSKCASSTKELLCPSPHGRGFFPGSYCFSPPSLPCSKFHMHFK